MSRFTKRFLGTVSNEGSAPLDTRDTPQNVADGVPVTIATKDAARVLSEQISESEAVMDMARLMKAVGTALTAKKAVEALREASVGIERLGEVIEVINEAGGFSKESLVLANLALEAFTSQFNAPPIDPKITLESFSTVADRLPFSLEGIEELTEIAGSTGDDLAIQARNANNQLLYEIRTALRRAKERLESVLNTAAHVNGKTKDDVVVGDGIIQWFEHHGKTTKELTDRLVEYSKFGEKIMGAYREAADRAAAQTINTHQMLDVSTSVNFWASVEAWKRSIQDPRDQLTSDDMSYRLPNNGLLFGGKRCDYIGWNPVVKALCEFENNCSPLDPSAPERKSGGLEVPTSEYSAKALSPTEIKSIGDPFYALCERIDVEDILTWQGTVFQGLLETATVVRAKLDSAPSLGPDSLEVICYIDTIHELATWPILHFLVNFVHTLNAFTLYAQRSLATLETPVISAEK